MALQSKKIFIDSSVFISFIDGSNSNHSLAVKSLEYLAQNNHQLYTSSQAVQNVYAIVSKEIGMSVALEFLQASLQSNIEIIFPQKADFMTVNRMLHSNRERQLPLRETLNATLMQKRGIVQILTFNYWHNLFGSHVFSLTP